MATYGAKPLKCVRYCRMSSGNGRSFVRIGTKVYQCHNSLEIKIGRRKKEVLGSVHLTRKSKFSSAPSLNVHRVPFYPINPETNINSADEETTTQAYEYLSTLLYVLWRLRQYHTKPVALCDALICKDKVLGTGKRSSEGHAQSQSVFFLPSFILHYFTVTLLGQTGKEFSALINFFTSFRILRLLLTSL